MELNDLIVIDVDSSVEGKPFIGEKGAHYQLTAGSSFPAPGFPEQLVGMKRDEEKEFRLKIPERYPDSGLAGKEALFKVRVIEVKEERLPDLNDDFAKGVAPGIETLASLRQRISADLKKKAEEKARIDFEKRLIDAVVKKSEVEFPPILIDMEVNNMVHQQLERLRMAARDRDEYIKRLESMPEEELRNKYRPLAIDRVTSSLVLSKVAEEEKVEVSDAEIDAEIERMTQDAGDKKEAQQKLLNTPQNRESIRTMLTTRKTIQRLTEIARGSGKKNKTKKEAK